MARPVTLFTGQWADLPLEELAEKAAGWGFEGLELACWGDHFDVDQALSDPSYTDTRWEILRRHGLDCFAISTHLVAQAVCDRIDQRHSAILPPHVWGDGDPAGVNRRAAEKMKNAARAAAKLGVEVVNGFTGSSIWHLLYSFPPTDCDAIDAGYKQFADRWNPILDVFAECDVRFALEVHPTEIAFDFSTTRRALDAIDHREGSASTSTRVTLLWQGIDPVEFVREFADRIYHVHVKDAIASAQRPDRHSWQPSQLRRSASWLGLRSPGRGGVDFEEIIRALNRSKYEGPLSVEWEDAGMDREWGAQDALAFVRRTDFAPSAVAFDAAYERS